MRTVELSLELDRTPELDRLGPITATPDAAQALGVPHRTLDSLARQICQSCGWRVAPPLLAYRTRFNVAREILETDDLEGTLRTSHNAVAALLRSGIDLDALLDTEEISEHILENLSEEISEEILEKSSKPRLSKNLQSLVGFTREYRDRLHESHTIDAAELFWHAAKLSDAPQPLLVYGSGDFGRDALTFLDAIAAEGSLLHLPCTEDDWFRDRRDAAETLKQRGWTVRHSQPKPRRSPATYTVYPNLDTEVRHVLTEIKSLLNQGIRESDIVLVTRDEATYSDIVLDIAWEYDLPIRPRYPIPLEKTRFGAWMRLLLDAMRSHFAFNPTANLLRHPLTPHQPSLDWNQVRLQHPDTRRAWDNLGADLDKLGSWKSATRKTWVHRLQAILDTWNLQGQCSLWPGELAALYTFQEGLLSLGQPERDRLTFDRFARDVTDSLTLLQVPAQPGRGGVALQPPLSLIGAKVPYVFLLGVAEGIYPAPVRNDAKLDFLTRQQLNRQGFPLETAAQIARREAVSFALLLQVATTRLEMSYPQQRGTEPTLPSPFLSQFEISPSAASDAAAKTAASWEEARKYRLRQSDPRVVNFFGGDRVLTHASHTWAVEWNRERSTPFDRFDGVTDIPLDYRKRVFSASQLTMLGQCGFKWFATQLLHLAELAEAETELSGLLRGRLYHKTLDLVYQKAKNSPDLRQGMLDALEAAFTEAERESNLPVLAAWKARRHEHLERLRQTISQESFLPDGTEVLATEQEFEGVWYGLRVKGIIDRIDLSPEGVRLVEYKNRSSRPTRAKDRRGKAALDVQLPLYVDVAAPQLGGGRPVAEAYYYSLTKGKVIGRANSVDEAALSEFAQRVVGDLKQGAYPVEPDVDYRACQYCCHDLVCRKGKRLERKGFDRTSSGE
ncbi:ATP-dependent nuclease subunit B [Geitlerinema sp. FC II]|nr:ATP-dependent nuclease subunit B [Geitlerinema sp. FC II]